MAQQVVHACQEWGIKPEGIMDDAVFSAHGSEAGTLAAEYRRAGLIVHPARKGDRVSGWETMRRLMANAGKPDEPGLYVSSRCEYFLATVPFLDRDDKRPEDINTRSADHAADAVRYALNYERPVFRKVKAKGF